MKTEEVQQLTAKELASGVKNDLYSAIAKLQKMAGNIRLGNGRHTREKLQHILDDAQTAAEQLEQEIAPN